MRKVAKIMVIAMVCGLIIANIAIVTGQAQEPVRDDAYSSVCGVVTLSTPQVVTSVPGEPVSVAGIFTGAKLMTYMGWYSQ